MLLPHHILDSMVARLRQLPQQGYQQVNVTVPEMDLLAWLNQQSPTLRGYWCSKQEQQVAWLGEALRLETSEQLDAWLKQAGKLRVYGGHAFHLQAAPWAHFPQQCWILPRLELRKENGQCTLWLNANFSHNIEQEYHAISTALGALNATQPLPALKAEVINHQHQPDFAHWQHMVEQATDVRSLQDMRKVVLSRQSSFRLRESLNPHALLAQWRAREPKCYSYLFQFSPDHSFIGCSPERLFERHQRELHSEALAGTSARGNTSAHDKALASALLSDNKNNWENQVVADDVMARLQHLSRSLELHAQPELVKLKHVQHLKRKVHALLHENVSDVQLLQTLHPTPAVGGLPRAAALDYIHRHEGYARGWYCGAVGYLSAEHSELAVAIRCAKLSPKQLDAYAGAGIVAGSQAPAEWQELNNKMATLLELLQGYQLG